MRFTHFVNAGDEIKRTILLYEKKKHTLNLMDFDDLLTNWKKVLIEHDTVREEYSSKFMHILVDEYQDTNTLQAEIVDLLSSTNRNHGSW